MSSKDGYINLIADGNLTWWSVSACTSDSGNALENWQNRRHEVSMKIYARITRSVWRVGAEANTLPTYEGFPNLAYFLVEFEEKSIESQRFSTLDYVLKDMPARWWGTHKQSISKWTQCRRLMEIKFREEINYPDHKYTGLTNTRKHIEHYQGIWKEYSWQKWVHWFIHTL